MSAVSTVDLGSLATSINHEHGLVETALASAVEHAINAGRDLLVARRLVPAGQWIQWVEENLSFSSYSIAGQYMRFAHHSELIGGVSAISEARRILRDLPGPAPIGAQRKIDHNEVRELAATGMKQRDIAIALGIHFGTVSLILNPEARKQQLESYAAKKRRRKAEAKALLVIERIAAARSAGGGVSELYSLLRKAAQLADRLTEDGSTVEIRQGSKIALKAIYQAEDAVGRSLGVS